MPRLKRARRVLIIVAVLLVMAVLAVGLLGVGAVRQSFPQTGGELAIEGLSGKVSVLRDDRGIPTIYADTANDLFRGQGFVSAQDRFFEMDLRRHVTAGRLSEMVGSGGLDSDKSVRTMGWRRVAEQELPRLAPETRQYLQAYADGVNAYIGQVDSPEKMSLEYTFLQRRNPGYRVEPWTPVDSLAWLKAMAWDLRGNYNDELTRARLSRRGISVKQIALLYPPYPYDTNPPILSGEDWAPSLPADRTDQAATALPALPASLTGPRSPARAADVATPADTSANTPADTAANTPADTRPTPRWTPRPPPWRRRRHSSAGATTSAPTRGSSTAPARRPASRYWPTTRICRSRSRGSGPR